MDTAQSNMIKNMLRRTKRAFEQANTCQLELFDLLNDIGISPDAKVTADENTNMVENTLSEAITTYLQYGEIGEETIMQMLDRAVGGGKLD